jgi:hypothetical protein
MKAAGVNPAAFFMGGWLVKTLQIQNSILNLQEIWLNCRS